MKRVVKIALIAAVSSIAAGTVFFVTALAAVGGDFRKFNTTKYHTETYDVDGEFDKISVKTNTTADIVFEPSTDGACAVVCRESEKIKYAVSVQDGALQINGTDTRKWYDRLFSFGENEKLTVQIPSGEYSSLFMDTDVGDICIPKEYSFTALTVKTDTGDVECFASASDLMKIDADTGDITATDFTAGAAEFSTDTGSVRLSGLNCGKISVNTDTGRANLSNVTCDSLIVTVDTGDVSVKNVIVSGALTVETDTGDVRLEKSDAATLSIKTDTGDVTGTLLTGKTFDAKASTGDVDVPKTTVGGVCKIRTGTGDICIKIER